MKVEVGVLYRVLVVGVAGAESRLSSRQIRRGFPMGDSIRSCSADAGEVSSVLSYGVIMSTRYVQDGVCWVEDSRVCAVLWIKTGGEAGHVTLYSLKISLQPYTRRIQAFSQGNGFPEDKSTSITVCLILVHRNHARTEVRRCWVGLRVTTSVTRRTRMNMPYKQTTSRYYCYAFLTAILHLKHYSAN